MLYAKFKDPRPLGSGEQVLEVFAIYSSGHVAWNINTNFCFPFLRICLSLTNWFQRRRLLNNCERRRRR